MVRNDRWRIIRANNTSKYEGKVQRWVIVGLEINYDGLINVIYFLLTINRSYNDVHLFMQNASALKNLPYEVWDDYDVRVLMRVSKGQKRQMIGLIMPVSYKEMRTDYEQ